MFEFNLQRIHDFIQTASTCEIAKWQMIFTITDGEKIHRLTKCVISWVVHKISSENFNKLRRFSPKNWICSKKFYSRNLYEGDKEMNINVDSSWWHLSDKQHSEKKYLPDHRRWQWTRNAPRRSEFMVLGKYLRQTSLSLSHVDKRAHNFEVVLSQCHDSRSKARSRKFMKIRRDYRRVKQHRYEVKHPINLILTLIFKP